MVLTQDNRQIWTTDQQKNLILWNSLGELKCSYKTPVIIRSIVCSRTDFYLAGDNKLYSSSIKSAGQEISLGISFHSDISSLTKIENRRLVVAHRQSISLCKVNPLEGITEIKCKGIISAIGYCNATDLLAIGTDVGIEILKIKNDTGKILLFLPRDFFAEKDPNKIQITSVAWNIKGTHLYVGFGDGYIRILKISSLR